MFNVIERYICTLQELLSLLEHLDKHKQGHVTLDDFVQGLQAVRNAAVVTSTPPTRRVLKRRHTDQVCTWEKCFTPL